MAAITKEQARAWLDATTRQRALKATAVKRMVEDMDNGRWVSEVAPPIFISPDGEVVDGMHRLTALLRTKNGKVLHSDVKIVDVNHIEVIDTGTPRSLSDTLQILGFDNSKQLGAMLNTAYYWQYGSKVGRDLTRTRQVEWIRNNPNAVAGADAAKRLNPTKNTVLRVPNGTTATLWDIATYAEGSHLVEEFVNNLQMGYIATDVARRYMYLYQESKNKANKKRITGEAFGLLTVRVYLAWLLDENPSKLFARRSVVQELPGYSDWAEMNWS